MGLFDKIKKSLFGEKSVDKDDQAKEKQGSETEEKADNPDNKENKTEDKSAESDQNSSVKTDDEQVTEANSESESEDKTEKQDKTELYEKGLEKTNKGFGARLNKFFAQFRTVDEDFFDDLEELLIESDVGYETAEELTDELRDEAKIKKAKSRDE